ncbi:SIMPL domain-containing protein [Aurantiacibacter gilvus]|uniref:SIMPL domain-containing protein n=1 Tax=Aurantiacibacter gilvus TaxID=3139141 RepID=A0ABU9IAI6_9SPHN
MTDYTEDTAPQATAFWKRPLVLASAIIAVGLGVGGFMTGDGLVRAKMADRTVTVRGLAERDVVADLATWTLSYSATAGNLAAAQASIDRDTGQIREFFADQGFPEDALQPVSINASSYTPDDGVTRFTVNQRMSLRTDDVEMAQEAVRREYELVRRGVLLQSSNMSFTFTGLNEIKPEMVAEATRDARAAAEQFAEDSGAGVGSIRRATQGYFSITARDGDEEGWGAADSPFKKVRVVTTIDFMLD